MTWHQKLTLAFRGMDLAAFAKRAHVTVHTLQAAIFDGVAPSAIDKRSIAFELSRTVDSLFQDCDTPMPQPQPPRPWSSHPAGQQPHYCRCDAHLLESEPLTALKTSAVSMHISLPISPVELDAFTASLAVMNDALNDAAAAAASDTKE